MKDKIYTILLLLSFMVVISHELINHHHHEAKTIDLSVIHNHHESDNHHHDDSENKNSQKESHNNHNHPFPLHHHVLAISDFVYARTNIQETNPVNKISILFMVLVVVQIDFFEPPRISLNLFNNRFFLILSNYYPTANALRGPPTVV